MFVDLVLLAVTVISTLTGIYMGIEDSEWSVAIIGVLLFVVCVTPYSIGGAASGALLYVLERWSMLTMLVGLCIGAGAGVIWEMATYAVGLLLVHEALDWHLLILFVTIAIPASIWHGWRMTRYIQTVTEQAT